MIRRRLHAGATGYAVSASAPVQVGKRVAHAMRCQHQWNVVLPLSCSGFIRLKLRRHWRITASGNDVSNDYLMPCSCYSQNNFQRFEKQKSMNQDC